MQQRVQISTINPSENGMPDDVLLTSARIFEHLTPKLQQLLYESKKCQQQLKFKFFGPKMELSSWDRETDTSRIFKLYSMDDLAKLSSGSAP